jgi:hypothetical protein
MATRSIDQRRKIRALESKRDALLLKKTSAITQLAVVRAELKQAKR